MENETNTPHENDQTPEAELPKVRIIKSEEPEDVSLDDEYYLSQEGKALLHYLQMDEDDPKFARKIKDIQYNIQQELNSGRSDECDRTLIEQFALLDNAFRFYLSGGQTQKPDDRSFLLALRAQEQSSHTLSMVRRMMRLVDLDMKAHLNERRKEHAQVMREKRKLDKQTSRSIDRYLDGLSQ